MRSRYFRIFAPAATFFLMLVGTCVGQNTTYISLDQAIDLALTHNHSLQATRTLILQNQAQEITANLRPNPTLGADSSSSQSSIRSIFLRIISTRFSSSILGLVTSSNVVTSGRGAWKPLAIKRQSRVPRSPTPNELWLSTSASSSSASCWRNQLFSSRFRISKAFSRPSISAMHN